MSPPQKRVYCYTKILTKLSVCTFFRTLQLLNWKYFHLWGVKFSFRTSRNVQKTWKSAISRYRYKISNALVCSTSNFKRDDRLAELNFAVVYETVFFTSTVNCWKRHTNLHILHVYKYFSIWCWMVLASLRFMAIFYPIVFNRSGGLLRKPTRVLPIVYLICACSEAWLFYATVSSAALTIIQSEVDILEKRFEEVHRSSSHNS